MIVEKWEFAGGSKAKRKAKKKDLEALAAMERAVGGKLVKTGSPWTDVELMKARVRSTMPEALQEAKRKKRKVTRARKSKQAIDPFTGLPIMPIGLPMQQVANLLALQYASNLLRVPYISYGHPPFYGTPPAPAPAPGPDLTPVGDITPVGEGMSFKTFTKVATALEEFILSEAKVASRGNNQRCWCEKNGDNLIINDGQRQIEIGISDLRSMMNQLRLV